MTDVVQWMPSVVALTTVIISALISFRIAKMRTTSSERIARGQLVSSDRQAWLNDLRLKLARYLSLLRNYALLRSQRSSRPVSAIVSDSDKHQIDRELGSVLYSILLTLDPDEESHNKLTNCLIECHKTMVSNAEDEAIQNTLDAAFYQSRRVLKRELEIAKSGQWE